MLVTPSQLFAGVLLDLLIGDPQWFPHPVRGIGWVAGRAERMWRAAGVPLRLAGVLFWCTVAGATVFLVRLTLPWATVFWIYALLACRDLDVHAAVVIRALDEGDLELARQRLSWIVGRDTDALDEPEIVRAAVETVAENLCDGVVAPLFWLAVAGPLGMAAYKAVNTLDSMVGHRTAEYIHFGWASARMDDAANFIPARIAALLIWMAALLPGFDVWRAVRVTLRDGASQPSPNAGYPEAAMAGALGVELGGTNFYRGVPSVKARMGDPVRVLTRAVFGKVRILLYASEALLVGIVAGCAQWA